MTSLYGCRSATQPWDCRSPGCTREVRELELQETCQIAGGATW